MHKANIDRWVETTSFFMDGPGRLIRKLKSEKVSYDPLFTVSTAQLPTASSTANQEDNSDTAAEEAVKTEISVVSLDTFTAALNLKAENLNPLALNMANAQNPGGGVYKGSVAQEEDLFRRSNYFQVSSLNEFYPLGDYELLYSPAVAVYMTPEFTLIPELTEISCVACAAERNPATIPNPVDPENSYNRLYLDPHVADMTRKRIETIFQIGIIKKHDSLVLGGVGCGAFNNPQMRIIEYFNDCLKKYKHKFKKIVFAVLSKRDPNFDLFSEFIDVSTP
jgi:uncharacterized protein (TIGR02452 family)